MLNRIVTQHFVKEVSVLIKGPVLMPECFFNVKTVFNTQQKCYRSHIWKGLEREARGFSWWFEHLDFPTLCPDNTDIYRLLPDGTVRQCLNPFSWTHFLIVCTSVFVCVLLLYPRQSSRLLVSILLRLLLLLLLWQFPEPKPGNSASVGWAERIVRRRGRGRRQALYRHLCSYTSICWC